jgi:cytochrome c-type biogenesis protein CcmF
MDKIQYAGETLWIGYACKALIFSAFISALLAVVSYFISIKSKNDIAKQSSWAKLGDRAFVVHGTSILSLIGLMFYSMYNHKYEYGYVFEHVSGDLPMKYILSAFWEGQEGSFLLWMFWHIVIAFYFIKKRDAWHAPVLLIMALAEVWLVSMILGIHLNIGDTVYKIGSNPMLLIRETMAAPIFANADYLSLIKGRGLNPLLQNYWMTIHPPTVFAAFALSIVPFAYAIGALWLRNFDNWVRTVIPYALMAAAILGISLIMGSLWAYEALSFGGYWAWDPVENTSLVPWIILVGGIHGNLIARATGRGMKSTLIFYLLGFLMIVYSTLLTRSGVLGDTSAHAFTEMGLEWQLTFFLLCFAGLGLYHFLYNVKFIPKVDKEESVYSREFWVYVGSFILLFSAVLINASSSLPVFNKIARYFDPSYVGRVLQDPITHYNKYQLWIAVFIGALSGVGVWFNWRQGSVKIGDQVKYFLTHIAIAAALTYLTSRWISLPGWQYVTMCFASWFGISANAQFLFKTIKQDIKSLGAAIAHLGFGIMAIGILATGLNFKYLNNPFLFRGLFQEEGGEEKYLQLIKNKPVLASNYLVTYANDTLIGNARHYDIKFVQMDEKFQRIDSFVTRPNAVYANDFTKISAFNPDNRHYAHKDIFTCVVSLPPAVADVEQAKIQEDSLKYLSIKSRLGDTITVNKNTSIVLTGFTHQPTHPEYQKFKHDVGYELKYTVKSMGKKYNGIAAIGLQGDVLYKYPGAQAEAGIRVRPSENIIDVMLTPEGKLKYKTHKLKLNQEFKHGNISLMLTGFDRTVDTTRYNKKEGDISIAANVVVKQNDTEEAAHPIFVIRDSAPMIIKDYLSNMGLHIKLTNIDPNTDTFEVQTALDERSGNLIIPFEIATDVPRSDYLILEAKIFPGINLYWAGAILMMIGLLIGWFFKNKESMIKA